MISQEQEQIFKLLNAANSVEDFHNSLQEHQINIVPKQIVVNAGQSTNEAAYNTMIENAKNIEKKTLKTKRIVSITPAIAALIFMSIIGAATLFHICTIIACYLAVKKVLQRIYMPEKDENWRGYIKEHINNCTISNINNNKDKDIQKNIENKVTLLLKNATNIKDFQKKFSKHHLFNEEITETLEAIDNKIQNNKTLILNSGKATSGITALAFNFIIGGLTVPHIGIVIGIYLGFKYLADKFEEKSNTKWRDHVKNNIKNIKEYNHKLL